MTAERHTVRLTPEPPGEMSTGLAMEAKWRPFLAVWGHLLLPLTSSHSEPTCCQVGLPHTTLHCEYKNQPSSDFTFLRKKFNLSNAPLEGFHVPRSHSSPTLKKF